MLAGGVKRFLPVIGPKNDRDICISRERFVSLKDRGLEFLYPLTMPQTSCWLLAGHTALFLSPRQFVC